MSGLKLALVSVSDKSNLDYLGEQLSGMGYTIISSGGTAKYLRNCMGVDSNKVMDVSDFTGIPESPDGLVKTLQGKVHSGLLMNPRNSDHAAYMAKTGAHPFDFVAVNLYPFAETIAKNPDIKPHEAAEQIDIGGPSMLRSAAKGLILNQRPLVVCDPEDYGKAMRMLDDFDSIGSAMYLPLARKVFAHTAEYEKTIDEFLSKGED